MMMMMMNRSPQHVYNEVFYNWLVITWVDAHMIKAERMMIDCIILNANILTPPYRFFIAPRQPVFT